MFDLIQGSSSNLKKFKKFEINLEKIINKLNKIIEKMCKILRNFKENRSRFQQKFEKIVKLDGNLKKVF